MNFLTREEPSLVELAKEAFYNADELGGRLNRADVPDALKERAERAAAETFEVLRVVETLETKTRRDQQK